MTKAAILEAPGQPLRIDDVSIDNPGPHEVLIRTAACGLCHSDLTSSRAHTLTRSPRSPAMRLPGSSRRSAAKSVR